MMEMMEDKTLLLEITDVEYVAVTLFLVVMLCFTFVRRRDVSCNTNHPPQCDMLQVFGFGKDMSVIVKGVSCIMILMSHYSARVLGPGLSPSVSYYVTIYAANVALAVFMFCSGYGLSLSAGSLSDRDILSRVLWDRLSKVYFPLLFVGMITTVCHRILYGAYDSVLNVVGIYGEWYVNCIMIFYTIFYVSLYLSRRHALSLTYMLSLFMILYFVVAYNCIPDNHAHYYRFPLAFMFGHIVAVRDMLDWRVKAAILGMFSLTLPCIGIHYVKCYVLSIVFLAVFGLADRVFEVKRGMMYTLGAVSFFFYLSHERIAFPLMRQTGVTSCILWIVLTFMVSLALYGCYTHISHKLKIN